MRNGVGAMWRMLRRLVSQDQAVANAREASTLLCRRRVEREEVALYLQQHAERRAGARSA